MTTRFLLWGVLLLCVAWYVSGSVRVRREIRSLSEVERRAVFNALLIMKSTSTPVGQVVYGPQYISYDELVMKHFDAAADPRCDQAHLGPAFPVYHRAFVLQFERSLMAIDKAIEAAPYWDYNLDSKGGADPRKSIMWSDDWFGSSEGDDKSDNAVLDGFFSKSGWRVSSGFGIHNLTNPFGLLRAPFNNNSSPFVTRHRSACQTETNINLITVPLNWSNKCIICPTYEECQNKGGTSCQCSRSTEARCIADAAFFPLPTYGDFADVWTSPNDPVFMFHHANVDRNLLTWQKRHNATAINDYGGYPKASFPCYGHGLDDVLSSRNPFINVFDDPDVADRPLTAIDVLTRTSNEQLYTYDSMQQPNFVK